MNLNDKFGEGNRIENEARRASALTKKPTRADNPSFNHVRYAVSNFVSNSAANVSNYLTSNAKKTFDQLRQACTKAPIF